MRVGGRTHYRDSRPARFIPWAGGCAWLLIAVVALLAPLLSQAASLAPPPPLRDYAVDLWTSRDGLPHNSIRDIAQTADGYLWFATWEGLVRYDGLEFTTFDRSTHPGLADNGIGGLYVDPSGALWLSDSRGNVSRYTSDGKLKIWQPQANAPAVLLPAMSMDHQGRLWMLFEGRGLAYLSPDGQYVYEAPAEDSPLRSAYAHMLVDAQDRVWVGSNEGLLIRESNGHVRVVSEEFGLPAGLAWPYLAPDGTTWVVAQHSLYRLEQGKLVMRHQLPEAGRLTTLLQDRRGDLWIGTESMGLLRAGSHGVETLSSSLALPRGRITSLREDAEGSIWVGANGGLFRLRETLFTNITMRDGLGSDYVRSVLQGRRGELWVGHSAGLDRVGPGLSIRRIDLPTDTDRTPSVLSLAQHPDGALWIGTANDGLYRRSPNGTVQHYGADQGLAAGTVRGISIDPQGVVWLATQRGVVRVQGERVVQPPAVPTTLATSVYSESGAVWVGTLEGAFVLRGDQVQPVALQSLGGGRTVFGFIRLGGAMWISSDRGLYRLGADGQLARVGLEQGVPVDTVFQLVAGHAGELWITSNRGVLQTDLKSLQRVADGLQPRVQMTRYNEMDGMANSQANGSSGPTAVVRPDGTLWVATAGGVSMLDPARLQWFGARPPPPVVIDSVQQDGLPLPWHDVLALSLEGGRRLSVRYVGLSYLLPERTQYRTRLEGLDTGWVARGRLRSVEFVGLPPGDYTLHVSAAHPNGPWSQREALLRFSIQPKLWQRHSVQIGAALLLALLLFGLYRYRVHRYQANTRQLSRLVEERTADLQVQAQQLQRADQDKTGLLNQLRLQSEAFERQAREDVLTGLLNRRALDERLEQEIARARRKGQPLCIAMLDVDHFKKVNDLHSHGVGDQVLRQVGELLRSHARDTDLAARSGGEEFCLVFTETSLEQAAQVCQRLRQLFHAHTEWGQVQDLRITFSAGLVELEDTDLSAASLYQRADRLLYRAKHQGRDRIEWA